MGRNVEQKTDAVNPKEFERMEKKLEETTARLGEIRIRINSLEDEILNRENQIKTSMPRQNKLTIEIQSLKSQHPMIQNQIKNQETKYKESALDQTKLKNLETVRLSYETN